MDKQILIIDDSITTREFLNSVLKNAAYKITMASNGAEGYQILKNGKFDLIITDLLMPEMNGLELMKKLHEEKITIPIIVITADIQNEVRDECFALGAKEFINKPILDPQIIISPVKNLIN